MRDEFKTETYHHNGREIKVSWFMDEDMGAPWEEHDGHGEVRCSGHSDKRAGERLLHSSRDGYWFYNWAGAVKTARKDWGLSGEDKVKLAEKLGHTPTTGEIAAESAQKDFDYLQRWLESDWYWVGYTVEVDGEELDALWGIDSDSMDEFEAEAVETAKRHIDRESAEGFDAACRDIVTA